MSEHSISDLRSFETVTGGNKGTAALYFWYRLDLLIGLAYSVSCDFFARPQLYKSLSHETVERIAELHGRYGTDPRIPSLTQRQEIFWPLFGSDDVVGSGAQCQFAQMRNPVLQAAARFTEASAKEGRHALETDLRANALLFRDWLADVTGSSLLWSREQVLPQITEHLSYQILRDRHVTAVFGVAGELAGSWPYQAFARADTFVEQAFRQLGLQDATTAATVTRSEFAMLQQVARRGAEAISVILTFDEDPGSDLHLIVAACYTWLAALRSLPSTAGKSTMSPVDGAARTPYLPHAQTNLGA
jgi:hypothetical protein